MDSQAIERFLADPERLMAFALRERELADAAERAFRDPIAARALRRSAEAAQVLAGQGTGRGARGLDVPSLFVQPLPMRISVAEAARQLEARGVLKREGRDVSDRIIARAEELLARPLPQDLIDFYRECIAEIGEFQAMTPGWNDYVGWHGSDGILTDLMHADAVPVFDDGCGSLYGLDITMGVEVPAVYFFDHEHSFEYPAFAGGSSLGAFMLLLADHDRAIDEKWPEKWELKIDPDLERCPRAPAIWDAG